MHPDVITGMKEDIASLSAQILELRNIVDKNGSLLSAAQNHLIMHSRQESEMLTDEFRKGNLDILMGRIKGTQVNFDEQTITYSLVDGQKITIPISIQEVDNGK